MTTLNRIATAAVAAAALAATVPSASAQSPEQFFRGKTVNLYIGFAPGGGYDYYGREVARFLGKHIPGSPNVVPQNMPGAGSFKAANYIFAVAPKDGTAIGIVTQTIALEEALGTKGVQYKSAQFNWIGRATAITEVTLTWETSKAKTIEDAKNNVIPVAGTGSGSPSEGYPKLLNGVVGTKFKVITGYPGSTDGMLAMERGEVDGALTSWNTLRLSKADWIRNKKINILVQYVLERDPDLKDIPTIVELGKSDLDKKVLAFYASGAEVGRSFIAPPGVPADRVQALRAAFDAMLKDPDFLGELQKAKAEFRPASGEQMQALIKQTAEAPKEVIDLTKKFIQGE
ncbi:MAG: Bug family tripartite tricarboxylate transporter substrate binding protein [Gemmatimonas sp.]